MWHHEVLKMVIHVLETDCAELIASLFEKGDILQHILSSADSKDGCDAPLHSWLTMHAAYQSPVMS